ncbi:isochorismatase family protein [Streptomyces sp. NRRL S-87]|uniref:isochorismatase family protein n=1 Tax=Streptomyces sp. NRRL S-87 TaxID=1463920 RepID=UPI0004BEA958|nr:isochorismatase family protein [Streptomyces sp. NRRL S-87]
MTAPQLTDRTALVLVDLQKGILARDTVHPTDEILRRAVRLAEAFRTRGLPVVLVKVAFHPDGGDLPPADVDRRTFPDTAPPAEFSELPAELTGGPGTEQDVVVTKRHWGAFTGTELDLQLRRRGIDTIVLGGISTSIGVESTARSAWELSYGLLFVQDATTDLDADSHAHSFGKIFPRIGHVTTTDEVLAALKG